MSPEVSRRNAALRLAFAVTAGLLIETARGAVLPVLAPVIALQLLAAVPGPPGPRMIALMVLVSAGAAALAYAVAVLTVDEPLLYAIGVGLLYLWGHALTFRPGTTAAGVMVVIMTIVVTGVATASTVAALGLMLSLVQSVALGFAVVLLAHAALPSAPPAEGTGPAPEGSVARLPPGLRALAATLVILPAHLVLFAGDLGPMLVLMTIATMLRQPGIAASVRYAVSFAAGNLLGTLTAALAMLAVAVQGSAGMMVAATAAAALALAALSARGAMWRAVTVPGMVAFTVIFGMVYSPYLATTEVPLLGRAAMVVAGALYAAGAVSVLAPLLPRLAALARPAAP